MNLSSLIDKEVEVFQQEITLKDGITFNHYDIIKRINLYMNDEFYECDEENALFWNLAKVRSPHFAKKLDLDTKNFKIDARGDNNFYQGWVMNIRFQKWARESGFALDLNDLSEGLADYGSIIMKLTRDENDNYKLKECDFTKLYFDTSVEDITKTPILELHELTELQIRAKTGVWDASGKDTIEKALENAEQVDDLEKDKTIVKYKIWERTGERIIYKKNEAGEYESTGEIKYMHEFVCGTGDDEVLLFDEELEKKDLHYYDFHIHKYRGRFLRVGVYERLFKLIREANAVVNENSEARRIASLIIFLSKDKNLIGSRLLEDLVSGTVLPTDSLTELGISKQSLISLATELMPIEQQADRICLTPDVITGDKLPSGATFRGQAALMNVASSAFKNPRDRCGFKLFKVLINKVLPEEVRNWNKEDVIEIAGDDNDVKIYDDVAIKFHVNQFIKNKWEQGTNPKPEEIERFIRDLIKEFDLKGRKFTKMKGFFNFKYGFSSNPTGENENKEQSNEVYYNALLLKRDNPAFANDPLFRQYLENNGIPPHKVSQDEIDQFMKTQGGSGASPQLTGKGDKLMSKIDSE